VSYTALKELVATENYKKKNKQQTKNDKTTNTLRLSVEVRTISSKARGDELHKKKLSRNKGSKQRTDFCLSAVRSSRKGVATEKEMIEEGGGDSEHQRKARIDFTNANQRAHGRNLFPNGSVFG